MQEHISESFIGIHICAKLKPQFRAKCITVSYPFPPSTPLSAVGHMHSFFLLGSWYLSGNVESKTDRKGTCCSSHNGGAQAEGLITCGMRSDFPPRLCSLSSLKPCFVIPKLGKKKAGIIPVGIFVGFVLIIFPPPMRCFQSDLIDASPLCFFYADQWSFPGQSGLEATQAKSGTQAALFKVSCCCCIL